MNFFSCLILSSALPAQWTVTAAHEISRPDDPATLSGITCVSGDTYLAATDWQPTLYELKIPLDPETARPLSLSATRRGELLACEDVEDVASDPLDRTRVFSIDEHSGTLNCHSITGGQPLATRKLTGALARTRLDMGLESLAISPDGLTLWTANEEATEDDGPVSTRKHGTDVRIARFRRNGKGLTWRADGEWVYRTDPKAGGHWKSASGCDVDRSGVSALCVLHDGTLLALEREFSVVLVPRFRCRLYEVDLSAATDVADCTSVSNRPIVRAGKRLLHEAVGLSMYEGVCEGPRGADGSTSLVLVSDADHRFMVKSLMTLKLKRKTSAP